MSGQVDPPRRQAGRPCTQKNVRRPRMDLVSAKLLDGIERQPKPLVGMAGKGMGGAEGRGHDRSRRAELPRLADLKVSCQNSGGVLKVPTTKMCQAKCQ